MAKNKFHIGMLIPGMPFNGDTPYKGSLGGSETAGWAIARELSERGHTVRVFSNLPDNKPGMFDGVQYFPLQNAQSFFDNIPHDVSIIQRAPDFFAHRLASKLHILWNHDLAQGRNFKNFRSPSWNIDACAVVSEYMKKQYTDVYEMQNDYFFIARNGVMLDDLPPSFRRAPYGRVQKRDRKRLVYSARFERGIDVLVERIVPPLFEADPNLHISIFGYYNPVDSFQAFYTEMARKCAQYGNRIMFEGFKDKRSLYTEYCHSGVYVYPGPSPIMPEFAEVSCISVMEAMACGMPVVASNRGALSETLAPGAGVLIDGDPMSDDYRDAFVKATLEYVNNDGVYSNASAAGRMRAESLDWSARAEEWEVEIEKMFAAKNDDPVRRAYHFYRNNDVIAARVALGYRSEGLAKTLSDKIDKEYAFADSPEAFKKHYIDGGKATTERLKNTPMELWAVYGQQTDELRYKTIEEYLAQHPELENILDYGCGHGWGTVYFNNKVGRTWTGVDVDPGAIEWSRELAKVSCKDPNKLTFLTLPDDDDPWWAENEHKYDMALVSEVLEHVLAPYYLIDKIERLVKPGGTMYITVPYGPSEYGTHNWEHFRNHLHHFEYADLETIFAKKISNIVATLDRYNDVTGDPTGFYTVVYKADHTKPVQPLDMVRKQLVQVPQQTLSVNIITGPGCENTLRWCLESVRWVADEIVLADTGMSDKAIAIADEFGCIRVPAPQPLLAGFDEPRNVALAASSMDWVLWIDTDEKLFGALALTKYLRDSPWHGLAIRQHHFAVDTSFPADVPVRLFRRRPFEGKTMKFHGAIHEHPELGLNQGPGPVMIVADVNIAHIGYLDEPVRRRKFDRNYPMLMIDQKKNPDRKLQKYFIMRDNCMLNGYDFSMNGGVITEAMRDRARQTCELYQKYFSAKEGESFLNINPFDYYTQALKVLGEGIDVQFQIAVNRDGVGDNFQPNLPVYRFKDAEEFEAEMARAAKNKCMDLSRPFW